MVLERKDISLKDKWNVESLYPTLEAWEKDFKIWAGEEKQGIRWPNLASYKGRLGKEAEILKELIAACFAIDRHLSKLYTYAHLRHDEDVTNDVFKNCYIRISSLCHTFQEEVSWIQPEILSLPQALLDSYLASFPLSEYKIYLEKIVRVKPHTLSADQEQLLALSGKSLGTAQKAFSAFNNADLKFPNVVDSKGESRELTHGKVLLYLRDPDRKLREETFKAVAKSFAAFENTVCELINGQVQTHVFERRARHYASCLEAALFPSQIDPTVYTSLISTVRTHLPSLHRYMKLRKKLFGYSELHLYDLHVPLVPDVDLSMEYEEAEQRIIESVAPLGEEYQKTLRKGLLEDRWVDRFENANKRSGAYSSGCYDSVPYILMNYQNTLNDVKTLAHEAGHSMHSFLSNKHQPYQYASYPIFVAEVASTFNEELLSQHLLSKITDKKKRAYLINQKIDDIRATFFRQTMFAEFELLLHTWADQDIPLTPTLLKKEYYKLNLAYFGNDVVVDKEIEIEWARIPHFYYNFYVYQYATGISAALALYERLQKEGERAREDYLRFLSSGCSKYPLDLLKIAGVDMRSVTPVEATVRRFDELVTELEHLLVDGN